MPSANCLCIHCDPRSRLPTSGRSSVRLSGEKERVPVGARREPCSTEGLCDAIAHHPPDHPQDDSCPCQGHGYRHAETDPEISNGQPATQFVSRSAWRCAHPSTLQCSGSLT